MEFLYTALSFILVLGILVTVHEFGHFIAARLTGMRVETFAVGMGNRLFGFNKLTRFTFGSLKEDDDEALANAGYTDYRVSMLPIGGYVKISGMIDESMDDGYLAHEPQPYEFRSKNALQKLFVMTAGVMMNIILAVVIFAGIVWFEGKTVVSTTTIGFIEQKSVAEAVGLKAGDKVITVNEVAPKSWEDFRLLLVKNIGTDRMLFIERNGSKFPVRIPDRTINDALSVQASASLGILPQGTAVLISAVETLKPAGKLGLMAGDTLLRINDLPIHVSSQLIETVKANVGKEIFIEWKRGASVMSGKVVPDADGRIGVAIAGVFGGEIRRERYGMGESVVLGVKEMVFNIEMQVAAITQIFKGQVSAKQSLGGPIQIAKMSRQSADAGFAQLLRFTALLSVVLAIMNILPFPALDGGHVVFILVEAVIRREVPVKVKMAIQQAGVVLLLCFMVFVVYNDLTR